MLCALFLLMYANKAIIPQQQPITRHHVGILNFKFRKYCINKLSLYYRNKFSTSNIISNDIFFNKLHKHMYVSSIME